MMMTRRSCCCLPAGLVLLGESRRLRRGSNVSQPSGTDKLLQHHLNETLLDRDSCEKAHGTIISTRNESSGSCGWMTGNVSDGVQTWSTSQ